MTTTQLVFEWPGTEDHLDPVNDRDQIRALELVTYTCGVKREFHPPHLVDGVQCPGLTSKACGDTARHTHHRWHKPDSFYWCNGVPGYPQP